MAESVARNSITSGISAEKRRASKSGGRGKGPSAEAERSEKSFQTFFAELARLAEMSVLERQLRSLGFRAISGTDEVGRGCLAGPVVAAAVIVDESDALFGVDDSKVLTHEQRIDVFRLITARARAVGIGVVDAPTIDRVNILQASKLAMRLAVEDLPSRPEILLVDAVRVESLTMPQVPIIHGDRRSVTIAAASIVAKVYRDLLMESYHAIYPQYDFVHNRGYGTEGHLSALERFGPSPIHRRSFEGHKGPTLFDEELKRWRSSATKS